MNFSCEAIEPRVFSMAPAVARQRAGASWSSRTFYATRLLQPVGPTSTRFVAPLLTQSDLSSGNFLVTSLSRRASRRTLHLDDDAEHGLSVDEQDDKVRAVLGRRDVGQIRRFESNLGVRRQRHVQRIARELVPQVAHGQEAAPAQDARRGEGEARGAAHAGVVSTGRDEEPGLRWPAVPTDVAVRA